MAEQIIGMKAGDHKAFDVTLPEDFARYRDRRARRRPSRSASPRSKEKQVPELNDELARSSASIAIVDEMRTAVRNELESSPGPRPGAIWRSRSSPRSWIRAEVELPPTWVDEQAASLR